MPDFPIDALSPEQRELWQKVNDLWSLSLGRDAEKIRNTLHPRYVGWDMSISTTHDREAAVQSVLGDAPAITDYELNPVSIEVYDHTVGIVHYTYSATVVPKEKTPRLITGKWSEVYLKQDAHWVMVSVSGKPDTPTGASGVAG